jgi:hypothetical protein
LAKFTIKDMEKFVEHAWGELGIEVVRKWSEFNARYFGGKLQPIPIIVTPTLPSGKRLARCGSGIEPGRRLIRLNVPSKGGHLIADNNSLLHEMVHQCLSERGENSKHTGEPWCLMRLNKRITGNEIWAGRLTTKLAECPDGKKSKVVTINKPHPDGRESLKRWEIGCWPHPGSGIKLGKLGA